MPTYAFRCKSCGASSESRHKDHAGKCPVCGDVLRREYGFAMKSSFQPHWNPAVGQYVRNQSEFRSALSRASDEASAPRYDPVTGMESQVDHSYVPIDPHDHVPPDAEESLATRDKFLQDKGMAEAKKRTIILP